MSTPIITLPETTDDFETLEAWYAEAVDARDYAQFTLMVYHQLTILADLDEIREKQSATSCKDEGCPHFGTPHGHNPASVVDSKPTQATGWQLKADTDKALYRHNHVSDADWQAMSFAERNQWIRDTATSTPGKTIVS